MKVGSLCTGYGGLDLAVGGELAWVAELDPHAAKVCATRYPHAPNLGDLTKIDWDAIEPVDVLTAGYPCQPFSHAGKRQGTADDRHIWPHIANAIRVLRPCYVFLENVAGHLSMGLGDVLADLAEAGYDTEWVSVRASDVGAPHRRDRVFILATNTQRERVAGWGTTGNIPQTASRTETETRQRQRRWDTANDSSCGAGRWGNYGPAINRWEHVIGRPAPDPTTTGTTGRAVLNPPFVEWMMGLTAGWVTDIPGLSRTQQLKILGNGVVPQQAAYALAQLAEQAALCQNSTPPAEAPTATVIGNTPTAPSTATYAPESSSTPAVTGSTPPHTPTSTTRTETPQTTATGNSNERLDRCTTR